MYLFIDTANTEEIRLAFLDKKGDILDKKNIKAKYKQSEKLLPGIDKLVGKNKKKLKGIIVVKGPGSFTGLRIGVTTANAMAFGLKIPVVGVMEDNFQKMADKGVQFLGKAMAGKWVLPEYGMEPKITVSRK